jgi:hypothetical protein
VGAGRAKDAQAHRKEFIAERCNAARDARTLRNRGEPACLAAEHVSIAAARRCVSLHPHLCPPCCCSNICISILLYSANCTLGAPPDLPLPAPALPAGVLRVHERLVRERNKLKDDDRAMRLEALKVGGRAQRAGGRVSGCNILGMKVCTRQMY